MYIIWKKRHTFWIHKTLNVDKFVESNGKSNINDGDIYELDINDWDIYEFQINSQLIVIFTQGMSLLL